MTTIHIPLVGNSFRGDYAKTRIQSLAIDEELAIVPEITNPYDPEALQVHTLDDQCFLGFVANKGWEEEKHQVFEHLDDGGMVKCEYKGVEAVGTKSQHVLEITLL